jgi:hypothetical protein
VNNLLVNNIDEEMNIVMDNIEEYVNEVEGNIVGQDKKYEVLEHLN